MGPPERGLEFAELTQFPPELLLADPDNVTYDKLELKNTGPIATFFDPRVGRSITNLHTTANACMRICSRVPGFSAMLPAGASSRQFESG